MTTNQGILELLSSNGKHQGGHFLIRHHLNKNEDGNLIWHGKEVIREESQSEISALEEVAGGVDTLALLALDNGWQPDSLVFLNSNDYYRIYESANYKKAQKRKAKK